MGGRHCAACAPTATGWPVVLLTQVGESAERAIALDAGADNRIAELRRALGDDPVHPEWIATVPGQGYRFVASVDEVR